MRMRDSVSKIKVASCWVMTLKVGLWLPHSQERTQMYKHTQREQVKFLWRRQVIIKIDMVQLNGNVKQEWKETGDAVDVWVPSLMTTEQRAMQVSVKEHPRAEGTICAESRGLERPDTGREVAPEVHSLCSRPYCWGHQVSHNCTFCHLDLFGQNTRHQSTLNRSVHAYLSFYKDKHS